MRKENWPEDTLLFIQPPSRIMEESSRWHRITTRGKETSEHDGKFSTTREGSHPMPLSGKRQMSRSGNTRQGIHPQRNIPPNKRSREIPTQQTNGTSYDDTTGWYVKPTVEYLCDTLDRIECSCNEFSMKYFKDLNKFWEYYFGVINLSNKSLNANELSLLGKGLKFCPTPRMMDHGKLKEDIDQFFRKCSLKLFFAESDPDQPQENILFEHKDMKLPSKFNPHMPSNLEHIYYLTIDDILSYKTPKLKSDNLNPSERVALLNLSDNDKIIIKKADKGSNVVIMNREDYLKEAHRQLNDKKYYMKLDKDLTKTYCDKIEKVVTELYEAKQIMEKTYKYLIDGGNRTPIFYMLPKVHKSKINPPGRPIVSSVNSPTERISQLVDIVLQPFAQKGNSFIKDTPDFLDKTKNIRVTDNDWLFALDVSSLYTNIPHDEGLAVIDSLLTGRDEFPSNDYIRKFLNMVLKYNCFRFNEEFYLQINGTAMGTHVAPTYAIIFMNDFENKYVYSSQYNSSVRYWFRFIDDIWGIFRGTEDNLKQFLNYLNTVHHSIKFTWTYSQTSVTFLDVITYTKNGCILTDLFVKPTDNHGYLDFRSCHPNSTKSSIPYSQYLRLRRNCSEWGNFAYHAMRLTYYLSARGYNFLTLRQSLLKVIQKPEIKLDKSPKSQVILTTD